MSVFQIIPSVATAVALFTLHGELGAVLVLASWTWPVGPKSGRRAAKVETYQSNWTVVLGN